MPGRNSSRLDAARAVSGWAFAAPPTAPSGFPAARSEVWLEAGPGASAAQREAEIAASAGCAVVQVPPLALAAVAARLRATAARVAARVAGGGALATTRLFDAAECLRLGADEIAWPLASEPADQGETATLAAAAALCHGAGASIKLLAPVPLDAARLAALAGWALRAGADRLAMPAAGGDPAAPAGAIAWILYL